jgi:chemotaxis protein methyltransferase WspC
MTVTPDDSLAEVFRLLGEQAGMEPESVGVRSIAHRVRGQMAAAGVAAPREFCRRLMADPSAREQLLEELLVPETWFFRDPLGFRCLAHRLADRRWSHSGTVRILSIACSTGEEVYSLAMALREAGLEPPQYSILGVDLSRAALAAAQTARYFPRSFRESNENTFPWRDRWFERIGDAWQVDQALRAGVEFRRANLSQPEFLIGEPTFHAIFCRNVLIYFHADARRTAVGHVGRLLRPDGVVWSGPAEAGIFAGHGFRSLGSECPFAFECPAPSDGVAPKATPAQRERAVFSPSTSGPTRPAWPAALHSDSSRQPIPPLAARAARPPVPALAASDSAARLSREGTLQAAEAAADEGRLEDADAICRRILAEDAACADAHCLRGVIRQAQGRFREAQQSLEKALYLDPRHYHALRHVILLAEQRGDPTAAANYRRRLEDVAAGETP